jgi:conjugation system TraG family ATPase
MRNSSKIATLESRFPLLAMEGGYLISKEADITACFKVQLPEIFTASSEEYAAIHSAWHKAVVTLPEYCIVHKQDWFISEKYEPAHNLQEQSFLSRSYQRHFNERPFLNHYCYLFITQSSKERMRQQSNFSSLCKGALVPKEKMSSEKAYRFTEAVGQFERIMNDSGLIKIERMTEDEVIGTKDQQGLLSQYLTLSVDKAGVLEDLYLGAEEMRVGNKRLCLHTLSDTDDLPTKVSSESVYEKLSTDRSDCMLSFAAPAGLLLSCDHIYNQYLFIDSSEDNLRKFERSARNMHSLSRYSRANQINKEWIDRYLNEAHSHGLASIRAHFNVIAWSDNAQELKQIKNDVGSAIALMECKPRHNTTDVATLYWAGMPGNAGDFPSEESFYTFIEPALCFFTAETNYRNSLSPFGIKMSDRLTGKPIHLDISDLPMRKGIITNRNKFVLGPSGVCRADLN